MTPLAKLLEAALFASATPVPVDALNAIAKHAEEGETTLESALEELRLHYDLDGHGWQVMWMDPAAAEHGPEAVAADAAA